VEILDLPAWCRSLPLCTPDARRKSYTSAPRAGAVGTKSRRGLSRASQIDARRMQHTAIIHMAH
jgi:hypothetical protein